MATPNGDMSMTPKQTPIEIAREAWPALAWSVDPSDPYTIRTRLPFTERSLIFYCMGEQWFTINDGVDEQVHGGLGAAIAARRQQTTDKLREALTLCELSPADRFTYGHFTVETDPATGVTVRYDTNREPERRWEVVQPDGRRKGCPSLSGAVGVALGGHESYPVRVVFHAGEAVLMLTDDYTGRISIVLASEVDSVEPWGDRSYVLTNTTIGAGLAFRESANDIRESLNRLQAERGGEGWPSKS